MEGLLRKCDVQCAWLQQRRFLGYRDDDLLFTLMTNENYRFHAYHIYIEFVWGYLGRHNRRVIPACVVTYIRSTWPRTDNHYTGYKNSPFNDETEAEQYIPANELAALMEGTEI